MGGLFREGRISTYCIADLNLGIINEMHIVGTAYWPRASTAGFRWSSDASEAFDVECDSGMLSTSTWENLISNRCRPQFLHSLYPVMSPQSNKLTSACSCTLTSDKYQYQRVFETVNNHMDFLVQSALRMSKLKLSHHSHELYRLQFQP